MDPFTIGAGLAGVGTIANFFATREANETNRGIARDQMNFQEHMSNTAHQREIEDLNRAGLNPTLSAGGDGSSTPSGASTSVTAPQIDLPSLYATIQGVELQKQKLEVDKQNSAAGIAKSLSETELNKMKKILAQKGMVKAELEGEAAEVMRRMLKFLKKGSTSPAVPKHIDDQNNALQQRGMP